MGRLDSQQNVDYIPHLPVMPIVTYLDCFTRNVLVGTPDCKFHLHFSPQAENVERLSSAEM